MRQRVLIDIEFFVDEAHHKVTQRADDVTEISDATDAVVATAVAGRLIGANGADQGRVSYRSTVITRMGTAAGELSRVMVLAGPGVRHRF